MSSDTTGSPSADAVSRVDAAPAPSDRGQESAEQAIDRSLAEDGADGAADAEWGSEAQVDSARQAVDQAYEDADAEWGSEAQVDSARQAVDQAYEDADAEWGSEAQVDSARQAVDQAYEDAGAEWEAGREARVDDARVAVAEAYADAEADGLPVSTEAMREDVDAKVAEALAGPEVAAARPGEVVEPTEAASVPEPSESPARDGEVVVGPRDASGDGPAGAVPSLLPDGQRPGDVVEPTDASGAERTDDRGATNPEARAEIEERVEAGHTFGGDPIGRIDDCEEQGQNAFGDRGTCGVASVGDVARDQGVQVSEAQLVEYAHAHSPELCQTVGDPGDRGGTTVAQRAELLSAAGVPNHVEHPSTQEELAHIVESDRGAIVGVSSSELNGRSGGISEGGPPRPDHAVSVTGVERDASGEIVGFVINDSGVEDGGGRLVSADDWSRCWASNYPVNVTDAPSPKR